jgi:hypothetical protein
VKLPLRLAFVLGAVIALIAAVIGIVIYAKNPGSNFYLIGWDELEHRSFAEMLLHSGSGSIFENALAGQALTSNATWGTGLLIGLCQYLFGSDLAFQGLKWVLHVLATLLLYGLVNKYRGERVAAYAAMFFLIYPPLLVYEASFLKDDLVAALVIIVAATFDRKWYPLTVPLVALLIAVRPNAVVFPVIFLGYLRGSRLRWVLLAGALAVGAAVLMLSPAYFQILLGLLQLPPGTVLFYSVKYLLGPLPTNILSYDTEAQWLLPWYTLSFLGILIGFFLPGFYASVRRNWRWILLLMTVCLAPYLPYVMELDIVGPRQFAAVGWLYFMLFYERVLNYGFKLEPRALPGEVGWSPAT